MASAELDELIVADADALRAWLSASHATSPGVWLALTKKGGTVTTLTWQQAVDEALCFGWIDGQARKRDQETSWIRFTPRRPRSSWSQRNVAHVARLEAQGRMLPPGRVAAEAARADGRWAAAYAPPSEAEVPADLLAAIVADPAAQAMFDVLTKANRFALIYASMPSSGRRPASGRSASSLPCWPVTRRSTRRRPSHRPRRNRQVHDHVHSAATDRVRRTACRYWTRHPTLQVVARSASVALRRHQRPPARP
jgi:uncharacterized protein YdeI (YjbR/CyaY-like superfamily)